MNSHWLADEIKKDLKKNSHPARTRIAILAAALLLGSGILFVHAKVSAETAARQELEQQQADQLQLETDAKAQAVQDAANKAVVDKAAADAKAAKMQEYYAKCLKLVDDTYSTQMSMAINSNVDSSTMATLSQTANSNRDYNLKKCDFYK